MSAATRIALTFDDGPSEWTLEILDLLAEHDAHATFFVCGHALTEGCLDGHLDDGHEVGNHTFTHPHLMALPEWKDVRDELARTSIAMGTAPTLWRAPYLEGSHDRNTLAIAEQLGLRHVGIDLAVPDYQLHADEIVRCVGRPLGGTIVGLHDGIPPDGGSGWDTRQPTVDALRQILKLPCEFVTVSEL